MKELREIIHFWVEREGHPLALATLVEATGSSYRRPGARMLIDAEGRSAGGLSAGCIEEEVIACGQKVLKSGEPQVMSFDTRRRFGCHGAISIFVERLCHDMMRELRDAIRERRALRLATEVGGERRGTSIAGGGEPADIFVQNVEPALQLLLLGGGSDVAALRAQALLLGWDVKQLDAAPVPRQLLDERTAVVIATHNYGRDCAALRDLLPLGLRYVGMIGSRRRRDDVLFDVMHDGIAAESELFAPAGLHLGAESPEAVALSIVAEIQKVFEGGTGQSLRHRKARIHQAAPQHPLCAESVA